MRASLCGGMIRKEEGYWGAAYKCAAQADTGVYYFNARWYDQSIGRFISEDPIKDGLNWYTYAGNNPLNRIDSTGLKWEFNYETWEWTATEESDKLWELVSLAKFDTWQEAAKHGQIRDWYDDEGNWIAGDKSLLGIKIKAPLDIYTATFQTANLSLWESGFGDKHSSLSIAGSLSTVIVENSRTNDAFSTTLFTYVQEAEHAGLILPSFGASGISLYGAFPRHYSDFMENEVHLNEIYESLLGESRVTYFSSPISYSKIESDFWRGSSIGFGFIGKGIGWGSRIEITPFNQQNKMTLIPSESILAEREAEFWRNYLTGCSSGLAQTERLRNPETVIVDPWNRYLISIRESIERKYEKDWRK